MEEKRLPNAEKIEKVADLKERIEQSKAILLTDYRGLTVSDATELRRSLRESGARFAVVKNTLMKRAAGDAGLEQLESLLDGPTAVAFVAGDPVGAAKKVVDAARRFPALVLKGGYVEGKVLTAEEAQALATLESREAMLSKIAGLAKGEMARAASVLQALQGRFLALLEAYREKLPAEVEAGGTPSESAQPQPEPAPEPASEPSEEQAAAGGAGTDFAPPAPEQAPDETPVHEEGEE